MGDETPAAAAGAVAAGAVAAGAAAAGAGAAADAGAFSGLTLPSLPSFGASKDEAVEVPKVEAPVAAEAVKAGPHLRILFIILNQSGFEAF